MDMGLVLAKGVKTELTGVASGSKHLMAHLQLSTLSSIVLAMVEAQVEMVVSLS